MFTVPPPIRRAITSWDNGRETCIEPHDEPRLDANSAVDAAVSLPSDPQLAVTINTVRFNTVRFNAANAEYRTSTAAGGDWQSLLKDGRTRDSGMSQWIDIKSEQLHYDTLKALGREYDLHPVVMANLAEGSFKPGSPILLVCKDVVFFRITFRDLSPSALEDIPREHELKDETGFLEWRTKVTAESQAGCCGFLTGNGTLVTLRVNQPQSVFNHMRNNLKNPESYVRRSGRADVLLVYMLNIVAEQGAKYTTCYDLPPFCFTAVHLQAPDMTNRMLHWLRCVRAWKADHRAHMDMCLTIRNSGSEAGPTMAPWLDLVPSRAVANKDAKQSLIFSDVAQGWNEYVISNMKQSLHDFERQEKDLESMLQVALAHKYSTVAIPPPRPPAQRPTV